MDNAIIDVVLGLVLLYLLLAILATKVQEIWDGQMRGGRALVMHDMLLEATGRNEALKQRILQSPAVFALYRGESKPEKHTGVSWLGSAASGPSKIPADLFARTLLVELYADGKGSHPSSRFSSPLVFIAEKAPPAVAIDDSNRIWGALRSLLTGREDWPAFEQAIARWFSDIGDRADGWFQRRSAKFSLVVAVMLSLALNVDSVHVADQLTRDGELRGSLSTLAQRVNALFPNGQEAPKEAAQAALKEIGALEAPLVRADKLMKEAITRVGRVFWRDDEVAGTKLDQWRLDPSSKTSVMPLALVASCARASTGTPVPTGNGKSSAPSEFLSNPGTWVLVLPALQSALHRIQLPPDASAAAAARQSTHLASTRQASPANDLRDCLSMLGGQIRSMGAMRGESSQAGADLIAAADALDGTREAIGQHLDGLDLRLPMARLYQRDPELFAECVAGRPSSQEALRSCLAAGSQGRVRLPIFHTAENRRLQFCRPRQLADGETDTGTIARMLCGGQRIEPSDRLGFGGGLVLDTDAARLWLWLPGCLLTALFVALGAPFWFDVLGKVSKVRAAGEVRKPDPAANSSGSSTPPSGTDDGPAGGEPFNLARNIVEKSMTAADIVALQRGLGIAASGVFDVPTRTAIAARATLEGLATGDEVSLILYERVVGRSMAAAVVPRPDGSLVLREPHPFATSLAARLLSLLTFQQAERFEHGALPKTFDDDLRAMAVLYRYKRQAGPAHQRTAVTMANDNRAALDTLDLALANEILDTAVPPTPASQWARDAATPWLDWAIGELGQIERNEASPAKSNPRIVAYLEAAGQTNVGDRTPWCAAFVTWVLERARTDTAQPAPRALRQPWPTGAAASSNWLNWKAGQHKAFAAVVPGDLVCFKFDPAGTNPADHIAFVLEVDQAAKAFWVIGGNQGGRGQVKVSRHAEREGVAFFDPF